METNFLRTFSLVVETGSMAEAARRQALSAAAVAQQLRALERDLGAPLVERAGRTVRPTAAGHRLHAWACTLLQDELRLRSHLLEGTVSGTLLLGTINTALHTLLPALLGQFAHVHPRATVTVRSDTSHALYTAVCEGAIDLTVCLHPPFPISKALRWQLLREEPLVLLVPAALAGEDPLRLLREQPLVRYDRTLGGGQLAERYLRMHGITARERFELSSIASISLLVEQGLGVALVPDVASPLTAALGGARIPLPDAPGARRFGLIWQRGTPRVALVEAFVAEARAWLQADDAIRRLA